MPEKPPFNKLDQLKAIRDMVERKEERETAEQARLSLEQALNQRFQEAGSALRFNLSSPEIPADLTEEHLKVFQELFGEKTLEPAILPKLEDLANLNEEYVEVMYPASQTDRDKAKGLISLRPNWWETKAEISGFDFQNETWGQAYLRSMQEELKALGGSFVLAETTQKPNYKDGKQHYGTKEGDQPSQDPFLPLFQEVFGPEANRFNHTWDQLSEQLLPKVQEKIIEKLKEKGLALPVFEVMFQPAPLFNLQTTLFHPANSQTDTWEWTSTPLLDRNQKDSGRRLIVGHSGHGGASYVGYVPRRLSWDNRGVRLAVVFRKKS